MHQKVSLAFAMVCWLATAAYAVPTVTAGNWSMVPGTIGNMIYIFVSGGDAVQELNFNLAIGNEVGPNIPIIAAVDIVGPGTIFHGNNTGQDDLLFVAPGFQVNSITRAAAGTVAADGTLALVTIDVPGSVPNGEYDLDLFFTLGPPLATKFGDLPTTLVSGLIHVWYLPEPASIVLALFAVGGLCAVAIRRRRRRA